MIQLLTTDPESDAPAIEASVVWGTIEPDASPVEAFDPVSNDRWAIQ